MTQPVRLVGAERPAALRALRSSSTLPAHVEASALARLHRARHDHAVARDAGLRWLAVVALVWSLGCLAFEAPRIAVGAVTVALVCVIVSLTRDFVSDALASAVLALRYAQAADQPSEADALLVDLATRERQLGVRFTATQMSAARTGVSA